MTKRYDDRLIDALLHETVGRRKPPDVSMAVIDRIALRRRLRRAAMVGVAGGLVAAAILLAVTLPIPSDDPVTVARNPDREQNGVPVYRGKVFDTGSQRLVMTLDDRTRVTAPPNSRLRVLGEPGHEAVELIAGEVDCRVDPGVDAFSVITDVGRVSVTGTEFNVRIDEPLPGDETMNRRTMWVHVLTGAVLVSGVWGQTPVNAEDGRMAFNDEGHVELAFREGGPRRGGEREGGPRRGGEREGGPRRGGEREGGRREGRTDRGRIEGGEGDAGPVLPEGVRGFKGYLIGSVTGADGRQVEMKVERVIRVRGSKALDPSVLINESATLTDVRRGAVINRIKRLVEKGDTITAKVAENRDRLLVAWAWAGADPSPEGFDFKESGEGEGDGDRPREGDGDRPREGDRPRDGDREGEGDRPRERDGDREGEGGFRGDREGDREGEGGGPRDREGDREGEGGFRGDREGDREGEGGGPRDREGDREGEGGFRGDREGDREGERRGPRDGEGERRGPRDGEGERRGPRDGEGPAPEGPRDGEGPAPEGPRDGEGPADEGPKDSGDAGNESKTVDVPAWWQN